MKLWPPLRCIFVAVWLGLMFAGCTVGPNYKRPHINAPSAFRGENRITTNSLADLPWWKVFHDDTLQGLIHIALTNNYDLRIAFTRVEQARALSAQAHAQFFPLFNFGLLAAKGQNVANTSPSPGVPSSAVFGANINASWEIDLWGRIRRLNEAARAQFFATEEARRNVMISLIGQVAQDYFQLLALDRQLEIARESTNSFGKSLKIFNQRLRGGVASKLETASAEALLYSAAATIPSLEQQIAAQENQLSVLLGKNPGAIPRGTLTLEKQMPPDIPAGLPSTLLERRPDIRQAEQQLRSVNAQVGVAIASFFPKLNLTGLFGGVSPELSAFTGGGGMAWSVAAGLTGPLFQGGQLRAQYAQFRAAREQAALQYQSTVLNAFQEISTALISREKLAIARAQQSRAVDAYKVAVDVALKRYRMGNASYYEVLQEQQQLFPAENALVQTQLNQLLAIVQLYRALGGGWEQETMNSVR